MCLTADRVASQRLRLGKCCVRLIDGGPERGTDAVGTRAAGRCRAGTRARQVNEQEARDFGISTDRACLEIEQIFYDADDDVLRHTITVDYSGQPYVTRHVPTPEELARRE